LSIKELQEKYNKQNALSTDNQIDRHVEVLEDEDEDVTEIETQRKRQALFSAKELETYAKQFAGFIQGCYNARLKAL